MGLPSSLACLATKAGNLANFEWRRVGGSDLQLNASEIEGFVVHLSP